MYQANFEPYLPCTYILGVQQKVHWIWDILYLCTNGCIYNGLDADVLNHEPLLLDITVCRTLYSMWPSFVYFSTVI